MSKTSMLLRIQTNRLANQRHIPVGTIAELNIGDWSSPESTGAPGSQMNCLEDWKAEVVDHNRGDGTIAALLQRDVSPWMRNFFGKTVQGGDVQFCAVPGIPVN